MTRFIPMLETSKDAHSIAAVPSCPAVSLVFEHLLTLVLNSLACHYEYLRGYTFSIDCASCTMSLACAKYWSWDFSCVCSGNICLHIAGKWNEEVYFSSSAINFSKLKPTQVNSSAAVFNGDKSHFKTRVEDSTSSEFADEKVKLLWRAVDRPSCTSQVSQIDTYLFLHLYKRKRRCALKLAH